MKTYHSSSFDAEGSIPIDPWIESLHLPPESSALLKNACHLAEIVGSDQLTDVETNCFVAGLDIAKMLNAQGLDIESIIAGLLYPLAIFADLSIEDIQEQISESVGTLVLGVQQLNFINQFQEKSEPFSRSQMDNMRKMLLTMVRDVRVVVIKLVEHLIRLRNIRSQSSSLRKKTALEARDIFAPLSSRLGLEKIKWELEDLAFRELDSKSYLEIAENLAEKRTARENRIAIVVKILNQKAKEEGILDLEIYGRPKHIYSIYKKMRRKDLPFKEIFDISAVRVIVPEEKDCYKILSLVNETWEPISKEFDDYIANPKPNGYQSIHAVIKDADGKYCEIQIRTRKMHEQAESGVVAHWFYKEDVKKLSGFDAKIDWLRSLLEWHKEVTNEPSFSETNKHVFDDRVYVFTPAGDILDLPTGSTPLDFAYLVHTDVGHRCRGAKINGSIIPLTYQLHTGDRIEIITTKESLPSRDWLLLQKKYLYTANARAKVLSWFKKQDAEKELAEGRSTEDRESQIAKSEKNMPLLEKNSEIIEKPVPKKSGKDQILVYGVDNLLSNLAKCCKPIPGDPIIGYITQGKGVTIHRQDCSNVIFDLNFRANRLMPVTWNQTEQKKYPVDLEILVYNRPGILRDLSHILMNENINVLRLNAASNPTENAAKIFLTIEVDHIECLGKIIDQLHQIPDVYQVTRSKSHERKNN